MSKKECGNCKYWREMPAYEPFGNCRAYMAGAHCDKCGTAYVIEHDSTAGCSVACPNCGDPNWVKTFGVIKPAGLVHRRASCEKFAHTLGERIKEGFQQLFS